MPTISFGKRQRFTYIASHALTERIVPPFLMRRLPGFFTNTPMGFLGKYRPIGLPKITGTDALAECGATNVDRDAQLRLPITKATM